MFNAQLKVYCLQFVIFDECLKFLNKLKPSKLIYLILFYQCCLFQNVSISIYILALQHFNIFCLSEDITFLNIQEYRS